MEMIKSQRGFKVQKLLKYAFLFYILLGTGVILWGIGIMNNWFEYSENFYNGISMIGTGLTILGVAALINIQSGRKTN